MQCNYYLIWDWTCIGYTINQLCCALFSPTAAFKLNCLEFSNWLHSNPNRETNVKYWAIIIPRQGGEKLCLHVVSKPCAQLSWIAAVKITAFWTSIWLLKYYCTSLFSGISDEKIFSLNCCTGSHMMVYGFRQITGCTLLTNWGAQRRLIIILRSSIGP